MFVKILSINVAKSTENLVGLLIWGYKPKLDNKFAKFLEAI